MEYDPLPLLRRIHPANPLMSPGGVPASEPRPRIRPMDKPPPPCGPPHTLAASASKSLALCESHMHMHMHMKWKLPLPKRDSQNARVADVIITAMITVTSMPVNVRKWASLLRQGGYVCISPPGGSVSAEEGALVRASWPRARGPAAPRGAVPTSACGCCARGQRGARPPEGPSDRGPAGSSASACMLQPREARGHGNSGRAGAPWWGGRAPWCHPRALPTQPPGLRFRKNSLS